MAGIKKIKSIYYDDSGDISKYDLSVTDSNGNAFTIFFGGNLDLYLISQRGVKSYEINKKDKEVYSIFDKLYTELKEIEGSDESLYYCLANKLFENKTFIWYSEDCPLEDADMLSIEKDRDKFNINFLVSPNLEYDKSKVSIRFTNSGSRNHCVVQCFMKLRQNLLKNLPDPEEKEISK